MSGHERFHYHNAEELLKKAADLGLELPFQNSIEPLFSSLRIGEIELPNRILVQPMEGCDATPDGAPGEMTFRRYRRYALGGSGLIWFEACSVSASGRSNPHQLMLTADTLEGFQRLVETTRKAARERFSSVPYFVLQMTHSGRRSMKDAGSRPRAACFNPNFDQSPDDVGIMQDDELESIGEQFAAAAGLARAAGFDAVDIKACHGYLLHELLGAFTRKGSRFGGSFENRSRMLLDIVRRVRDSIPGLGVAVRLNATDAIPHPYGFGMERTGSAAPDFSEPLRLQQRLLESGCNLLNITAGIPSYMPHVGRPFDRPARGVSHPEADPLAGVCALLRWAAVFQRAQPAMPVVGTGYSWLRHFWPHVAAAVLSRNWASLVGLGRGSFAYPDAPRDLMAHGRLNPAKCCFACSCCTDLMVNHRMTGCVLRDPEVYKDIYRKLPK
jgi:2,4-dienoyl-CoA reductase-like NADH-dependent reductase (Old Yellow Enzyme family)